MYLKTTVIALSLGCTAQNYAAPLERTNVAADAKWVLHLDMDAFRKTKVGAYLIDDVLEEKIAHFKQGISPLKDTQFETSLKKITSITAYGDTFGDEVEGVLLLKTTANVQKDLDALVGLAALSEDDEKDITKQEKPYLLYSIDDEIFVAPNGNGTVFLAKSKEPIERARNVVAGKADHLGKTTLFANYPKVENTFFFLGLAQGFNEDAAVPPQAQVLKETEGGRLVIGEWEEKLFVNLVFRGKSPESATKIQQVLQGIVALVSLSNNKPELTKLANTARITAEEQNVILNVSVPVSLALDKIKEKKNKDHDSEEKDEPKESDEK